MRSSKPESLHSCLPSSRQPAQNPGPTTPTVPLVVRGVRLRRVPRRSRMAWWLCCVAAGCSAAPIQESAPPLTPQSAVTDAATTAVPIGDPDHAGAEDARAVSEAVAPTAVRSRSAMSGAPLGDADLWLGTGPAPTGLQRALRPGDRPGPLLSGVLNGLRHADFRIVDMCQRPEVVEAWEAAGGPGALVPQFGMYSWEREDVMDQVGRCTSSSEVCFAVHTNWPGNGWVHPELPGFWMQKSERCTYLWRYVVTTDHTSYGSRHWWQFSTLSEAEQWVEDQVRGVTDAARKSTRLSPDMYAMGFADSLRQGHDGRFRVEFSPADAPTDEVQVLGETVAVSDGALRGLVRNWSRHMWAYEVAVSADGKKFVWPLSVQPGEVAPFEIHRWDGRDDPTQIRFAVTAIMSWHTDPSRALTRGRSSVSRLWVGPWARRTMSDAVRDRYRHVAADTPPDSISEGTITWDVAPIEGPPGSHPSLADDLEMLAVEDLRVYGAVLDGAGRVADVGPAAILDTIGWSPFDELFDADASPTEISSLSGSEDLRTQLMSVRFDVHKDGAATDVSRVERPEGGLTSPADFYERDGYDAWGVVEGGFILWIGAAYPERDLSGA